VDTVYRDKVTIGSSDQMRGVSYPEILPRSDSPLMFRQDTRSNLDFMNPGYSGGSILTVPGQAIQQEVVIPTPGWSVIPNLDFRVRLDNVYLSEEDLIFALRNIGVRSLISVTVHPEEKVAEIVLGNGDDLSFILQSSPLPLGGKLVRVIPFEQTLNPILYLTPTPSQQQLIETEKLRQIQIEQQQLALKHQILEVERLRQLMEVERIRQLQIEQIETERKKQQFLPETSQKILYNMQRITKSISFLLRLTQDLPLADNSKLVLGLQEAKTACLDLVPYTRFNSDLKIFLSSAQEITTAIVEVIRAHESFEFEEKKRTMMKQLRQFRDLYSTLQTKLSSYESK